MVYDNKRKEYDKRYRDKHKEEIKEYKKEYYLKNQKDSYFKSSKAKLLKREYENNPKRIEYRKKYRIEKGTEYSRSYYKSEVGHINRILNSSKRRLRERKIIEAFSKDEWITMLKLTKGICPRCKKLFKINQLTLDHIIPISKAPDNFVYTIKDIQALCNFCNASKSNKIEIN